MDRRSVARAIAYFEASDDAEMLRQALRVVQPKAAAQAKRFAANDRAPLPAAIERSEGIAPHDEAMRTLRQVHDFAQLQALARAIGGRIEELR
jgi:hypothetical protein